MSKLSQIDFSQRIMRVDLDALLANMNPGKKELLFVCKKMQEKDITRNELLNFSFLFSAITDGDLSMGMAFLEDLLVWAEKENRATVLRVLFRYFERINIPQKLEGRFLDLSLKLLENMKTPIAIKVFAMTTAFNISKSYPELQAELKAMIEIQLPTGSPGFRSRGKKLCRLLEKQLNVS